MSLGLQSCSLVCPHLFLLWEFASERQQAIAYILYNQNIRRFPGNDENGSPSSQEANDVLLFSRNTGHLSHELSQDD